ncbi:MULTISPECIES: hypothetical protein [Cytobacillus]|nr:hypothetical protein [Cytobacillus kochii]MDM5207816.1 hypothetical protein [Cytobacillus kochii]MDQ0184350.1 hypothetical protein [Cytobacillus kochii]
MRGRKNRILKYSVLFKKLGVISDMDYKQILQNNEIQTTKEIKQR